MHIYISSVDPQILICKILYVILQIFLPVATYLTVITTSHLVAILKALP